MAVAVLVCPVTSLLPMLTIPELLVQRNARWPTPMKAAEPTTTEPSVELAFA